MKRWRPVGIWVWAPLETGGWWWSRPEWRRGPWRWKGAAWQETGDFLLCLWSAACRRSYRSWSPAETQQREHVLIHSRESRYRSIIQVGEVSVSYLSVCVLYSGDVGVSKGSFDKPKDQWALPHPTGSEHHHPVVITLLGHSGSWSPPLDRWPVYWGRNEERKCAIKNKSVKWKFT